MPHRRFARFALLVLSVAAAARAQVPPSTHYYMVEPFNDNARGWALEGDWQIGSAVGSPNIGALTGDPAVDGFHVPGGGVAGTTIGGNVSTAVHPAQYLTSPAFDTAAATTLTLEFDRFLNTNVLAAPAVVEVFDGANWVALFANTIATDAGWTPVSFDVAPFKGPAFRVRFGLAVVFSPAANVPGWSVDNVTLRSGPRPLGLREDWNADPESAGWTVDPGWTVGPAVFMPPLPGDPVGDPGDDALGVPGGTIAGTALGGTIDVSQPHGFRYVTSPRMDLSATTDAEVRYRLFLSTSNTGATPFRIEVFDGTQWVVGLGLSFGGFYTLGWLEDFLFGVPGQTVPTSAHFRVRFGYAVNAGAPATAGFSVDHLRVGSIAESVPVGAPSGAFQPTLAAPPPRLGFPWTLSLTGAAPFSSGFVVFGPASASNPTPVFGLGSLLLVPEGFLFATTFALGQWSLTTTLPEHPAFIGARVSAQALMIGPPGVGISNALDLKLGF
jgi:hypothetical protein